MNRRSFLGFSLSSLLIPKINIGKHDNPIELVNRLIKMAYSGNSDIMNCKLAISNGLWFRKIPVTKVSLYKNRLVLYSPKLNHKIDERVRVYDDLGRFIAEGRFNMDFYMHELDRLVIDWTFNFDPDLLPNNTVVMHYVNNN